MDDLGALDAATAEFRRRLDAIGDDQWSAATPCGEWDVTALVEHLSLGNRMAELLLHGADAKTSVGPAAAPPADVSPMTSYDVTAAAQAAAFAEDGAGERVVHHPAMDMPGDVLLMFRTLDLALHALDLADSIGADDTLDADLLDSLWARLEPFAPLLAGSGMFGTPKGELAADASTRAKLLHATGR